MITPDEFPYIKSLYVNDCYTYKDFNIELYDYKPFSHLILTGKNGSGKSTILKAVDNHISSLKIGIDPKVQVDSYQNLIGQMTSLYGESEQLESLKKDLFLLWSTLPFYTSESYGFWSNTKKEKLYSFFKAKRDSKVNPVNTVTKEIDFANQLQESHPTQTLASQFKQYLVNKKVYQAFDQINKDQVRFAETEYFFDLLTTSFQEIFEDENLEIVFRQEDFEFFIKLSDGRKLTFDVLSEGFSALLSILMDLFTRVDLIRKQVADFAYNPCGIVLIDEPETHLHLQMQEQVLPLLTSLFPNIQFIVATHSPAVVASIKQATIFDLSTKERRISEDTVGRSYSDLMTTHFGLNNEYSATADDIIKQVNDVLNSSDKNPAAKKQALQSIYDTNSAYLSPTLKVELEMLIVQHDVQQEL